MVGANPNVPETTPWTMTVIPLPLVYITTLLLVSRNAKSILPLLVTISNLPLKELITLPRPNNDIRRCTPLPRTPWKLNTRPISRSTRPAPPLTRLIHRTFPRDSPLPLSSLRTGFRTRASGACNLRETPAKNPTPNLDNPRLTHILPPIPTTKRDNPTVISNKVMVTTTQTIHVY